jgi:8-oxo-dGTP pyrophosphatase MutT (NUDIX family)
MRLLDLVEKVNDKRTAATVWVILYTKDKVILGKRAPSTKNPNQWNFFGGHVDEGESKTAAAIRELKEETGYALTENDLKEISKIGDATYFVARISDPTNVKTTHEVSKVKGFKLTDLPDNLHNKTQNFFNQLDQLFA